jgi:pimeloyl-ACP methyl ester carboxylesterase
MTVPQAPMVLVHGAWGGAWIWRRVLGPLRAAGHEVHAVTLTGDGDRAHLRHPRISLDDHIQDVLALIEAEELRDVVLVGHSYGGQVITGVADALLKTSDGRPGPPALRRLVYVDAMVPVPGEGWGSGHPPDIVQARLAAAHAHGNALPPPDPEGFGLSGEDRDWLLRRQVPHPFGMYRVPLDFDGEAWARTPRTFIDCTSPAYPTIEASRQRVRAQPGWTVHELATGHCPMVSMPEKLTLLLLEAAA